MTQLEVVLILNGARHLSRFADIKNVEPQMLRTILSTYLLTQDGNMSNDKFEKKSTVAIEMLNRAVEEGFLNRSYSGFYVLSNKAEALIDEFFKFVRLKTKIVYGI